MPENVITTRMPDSPGFSEAVASDDLVWVWDSSSGVLRQCKIADLPFTAGSGGGSGSGTALTGTPFKIKYGDAAITVVNGDSIIADLRLSGKTNYPIYATQLNAELRDNDLVYDNAAGKVTLKGFILKGGEHITLYPDGVPGTSSGGNSPALQSLLDRLDNLELINAVFMPSALGARGGMVLWRKPAGEIPPGWAEVADWRGRLPIGCDPDDPDFATISDSFGGGKTATLTGKHLPAHSHFTVVNDSIATNSFPNEIGRALSKVRAMILNWSKPRGGSESYVLYGSNADGQEPDVSPTSTVGTDTPEQVNLLNPYRVVMFIEFIGI